MTRKGFLNFVLTISFLAAPPWAAAEQRGSLRIADTPRGETAGSFVLDGKSPLTIFFTASEDSAAGQRKAQVVLGQVELNAFEDLANGTLTMDGNGSKLSTEQVLALISLAKELGASWRQEIQSGQLARDRDFLFRHVLHWAEAPVGLVLDRLEIKIPEAELRRHQRWSSFSEPMAALQPGGQQLEACTNYSSSCPVYRGNCVATSCNQGSCAQGKTCFRCDNTTTYLSGCNYQSVANICHDADGSSGHCFDCETLTVGCNSGTSCVGRCGPGCNPSSCPASGGLDGEGTYTFDCAEHDRCCGQHGGCLSGTASSHCGDEYSEAYDDTIYGSCSCTGCY